MGLQTKAVDPGLGGKFLKNKNKKCKEICNICHFIKIFQINLQKLHFFFFFLLLSNLLCFLTTENSLEGNFYYFFIAEYGIAYLDWLWEKLMDPDPQKDG